MIACLAALKEETMPLRRRMQGMRTLEGPTCRVDRGVLEGSGILLVQTGMGRQRAEAGLRFVVDHFSVTEVLSFGFAGAVRADVAAGDIVLVSSLVRCEDERPAGLNPVRLQSEKRWFDHAHSALDDANIHHRTGGCVTCDMLISHPQDRWALADAYGATLVDMESFWIAKLAVQLQLPFLAVRTVSDRIQDEMPPFDQLMTVDGQWRKKETAVYFGRHPHRVLQLIQMASRVRLAKRGLVDAVRCLVSTETDTKGGSR